MKLTETKRIEFNYGIEILGQLRAPLFRFSFFMVLCVLIFTCSVNAAMSDSVIAFIDDEAITRSELDEQKTNMMKINSEIKEEEVLNTMINRVVLLREARKYRIEGASPDEVINEYIDLKVRAFIRVSESEIEKYYHENAGNLSGKEYDDLREDIEQYLTERKLNIRLKEALEDLKRPAYIKILSAGPREE